jgi:ATP synthase protein I
MSSKRDGAAATRRNARTGSAAANGRADGLSTGWTITSYMLSGLIAYGAIGWLVGRAVHVGLLFPIGMIVGLAISVGFVIYRYGRQGSAEKGMTRDR